MRSADRIAGTPLVLLLAGSAVLLADAVLPTPVAARLQGAITAKAAILVDRQTGVTLWQHNADLPLPPASTTKVATASLALQSGRLEEPFRVSQRAAKEPPSKIVLQPGWTVRLLDLVYAIMLNSANDASVVIAEGLAGSVEAFAQRMNAHARAVGAVNTHFVNPNGLPAFGHHSTARDLARIFDHALDTPGFRSVVETRSLAITPATGSKRRISLHSKNRLLHGYPIQVVGKTGWTRAAGKCFVGAGRVGERELIVAVLGSNDLWGDVRRLLEFGFNDTMPPLPLWQQVQTAKVQTGEQVAAGDAEVSRRYYVRLATFRSLQSAQHLVRKVRRDGFPARVYKTRLGGRTYYRVSVGSYRSRDQAAAVAERIARRHPQLSTQLVAG